MTSKRTVVIGQPATRRKTIGAIDGYFPSARQRRLNRQLEDSSLGAQMARDADAADTRAHSVSYLGRCQSPDCGQHEYGTPDPTGVVCRRCGADVK